MKIDEGPIFEGRLKIRKREDIKDDKSSKKDKKLINSKENLPEGHVDFEKMYKDLMNLQINIDSFNREAEDLLEKNKDEIQSIYDKWQAKYNEISEKFNDDTKELLNEFDVKRKELEKLIDNKDISKYTDKMKKLYEEMQKKWDNCRQEYSENESKAKEQEEREVNKQNKDYNSKLMDLKKKYNLK